MKNEIERPICHRAEDLVTYLYGEATIEEARDFDVHMQQCDACRAEFNVFNQVHESIVTWRNEALGPIASPVRAREDISDVAPEIVKPGRRLPAIAALREFFNVSPIWLRGATAFAGLLLVVLLVFAVSKLRQQPVQVANSNMTPTSTGEIEKEIQRRVDAEIAKRPAGRPQTGVVTTAGTANNWPSQIVVNRRPKVQQTAKLTRAERVQLAADLGLIQGREDEAPFVLPDQPNQ